MKLIICRARDSELVSSRPPVGELRLQDGILRIVLYIIETEIIAIKNDLAQGHLYILHALHKDTYSNGEKLYKQKPIGTMKVTKNGGAFIKLNMLSGQSFQVIDPERKILTMASSDA